MVIAVFGTGDELEPYISYAFQAGRAGHDLLTGGHSDSMNAALRGYQGRSATTTSFYLPICLPPRSLNSTASVAITSTPGSAMPPCPSRLPAEPLPKSPGCCVSASHAAFTAARSISPKSSALYRNFRCKAPPASLTGTGPSGFFGLLRASAAAASEYTRPAGRAPNGRPREPGSCSRPPPAKAG